jgi:hypothetical protein
MRIRASSGLLAAAAVLAVLAGTGVSTAQASPGRSTAAAHQTRLTMTTIPVTPKGVHPAYTWSAMCNDKGDGLCLDDRGAGGLGSVVQNSAFSHDNSGQAIEMLPLPGTCDAAGTVNPTCPFALGSGNNTHFNGDPIVHLVFIDLGSDLCAGVVDDEATNVQLCSGGTGVEWILAGFSFVNRYATDNDSNSRMYLYGQEDVSQANRQDLVFPFTDGLSQWTQRVS